ncbi:helix-turn-helix domain-containing protein [Maledivibacter halophilus]|uniref:DNA binding domain-containing protein, excisionase family n=1 Tax=Maledivibacter halophilus TaxID=36842 RepID=A0A1T5LZ66_9FIRM|nr:helix-turn-helix domain-containing protein [Maledivibacter halophilus]SKC81155.1 DNA binding domain-containing protein, excisionase family [Maledivibacter halophilus]
MEEKYYTIGEVASKLEVHTKTVRRYIYNGKIQALKVGGQWRIYQGALDKYYESSKYPSDKETVSQDDFCIFMDGQNRTTNDKLQVCSIIDYYVDQQEEAKPIAYEITDVIMSMEGQDKYRFNYVYDAAEKRVRFVLWGNGAFMEAVAKRLKKFDGKLEP